MRDFTVCVTGFETTGDDSVSPTKMTAQRLGEPETAERISTRTGLSARIVPIIIPLSFRRSWPALERGIAENRPRLTVILGHKGGMHGVTLERSAINRIQADRPDNDDYQPLPSAINENGPAAYWTRLPLSRVLSTFADEHVPASLSSDAGTFVCNMLFYRLMDRLATVHGEMGGLMCLPDFSQQTHDVTLEKRGLLPDQMLKAGEELISTTLLYEQEALDKRAQNALLATAPAAN